MDLAMHAGDLTGASAGVGMGETGLAAIVAGSHRER